MQTLSPGQTHESFEISTQGYRVAWNVAALAKAVVRLDMRQGSIGSGVVTIQQTHDWKTWQGLTSAVTISSASLSSEGATTRTLDLTSIAGISAYTSTDQSGALAALTLFGKNSQTIV
jgi:hypothetical protein